MRTTSKRGSPRVLYSLLAVLFVIAVTYQFRAVVQTYPQWFGKHLVQWPFLLDDGDRPNFILVFLRPEAHAAGLRNGDFLIAINGVPVTSLGRYADILSSSHPGGFMSVTYRRKGEPAQHQARVSLGNLKTDSSLFIFLLYVVMPAFSLALGFWVVAVRIQDVRAWLLLGLLLGFGAFFNAHPYFWSPPFRTLGTLYFLIQQRVWFVWLFLLGIYFPEPFPKTIPWKWWKWLGWIVLPLWVVLSAAHISGVEIELYSLMAAMPEIRFMERTQFLGSFLPLLMLAGFLACIAVKYRIASSLDAKRRLRVLYAGAAASILPFTVLVIIERWKGVDEEYFPYWLRMSVYVIFYLLPVTLAYVIVVQRAMDLRVVIRQGLQYTLARRGVLILQILLSAALFIVLAILMTSHAMNPFATVAVLAAGFWGIFLLHGATQRLAVWVDRRFFRDAYNAEQILSDLAENVRSIVETKPLLET
ncbi:MAG TPA: PDZ domain-containing protein, partial [Bryobacteraceae bacterium]|nr:PDZ domain-containing protein [Bryobacteraceae bacterium]